MVYFFLASISYLHTILLTKKEGEVSNSDYKIIIIQMVSLPTIASISTSFIPAESFLRATFITSVFMGMVGYIRNFLENSITKRLVIQYFLIFIFFLIVLILFKN
jgi:hypothetical protein